MRFYVPKRQQTPAVIIVALVDVLIVLLIFLLVTTTFKQQPALKIALPTSTEAQKPGANENAPLVISIDKQGVLRLGADPNPVPVERLKAALQAAVQKNPELKVAISGDTNAPWGLGIAVMDAIKSADIKSVNAFAKPVGKP